MVLQPPHLVNPKGELLPTAFIPICAYRGNLLGSIMSRVNFTICDIFEPKLVGNQMCYSLNPQKTKGWKIEPTQRNGLLLVIDSGALEIDQNSEHTKKLNNKPEASLELTGKILIDTLSNFYHDKAGTYILRSLKKMTGTPQFLGLPREEKGCQIESYDHCVQSRFIEKVHNECGCTPWVIGKDKEVV